MIYTGMLLFFAQMAGGSSLSIEVLSRKKHPNRGEGKPRPNPISDVI
jgi:hypothetical protein